jgi:hypothetical protein
MSYNNIQFEDAEAGRTAAIKARQRDVAEANDLRALLEEASVAKAHSEDRLLAIMKEKNTLQSAYDEQVIVVIH